MKNYWLDRKKNEEIKKIRLELTDFFNMITQNFGSVSVDWKYIDSLIARLKELEGKNA